ncbi:N-acetylmannosamine-6-phosphate 2-epimerase [Photobacterium sp. DA100]|uniref:N-acetylmannosamine-6-phosphate 2-epimerase n=1 Tax=Photobacterium sp. DA100 TaxID=3027472 RepID=UPI00247956F7|nr:N-acetylmannosamine-6-phosphate 2-epimerase [Photobacterium sp. DA100]WEM43193.1 N-acetylmannosamine-6-phosphate 2-epimerase [Photobacterium sp. DA100]
MQRLIMLQALKGQLIASVQALPDEPLHGPETMVKMAGAVLEGGAKALRVQSAADIRAVKSAFPDIPVIGLIKQDYSDSEIFITPTKKEVTAIIAAGADMVALDMTGRARPSNEKVEELVALAHVAGRQVMADIATYEQGITAQSLGADCISTTLSGYTPDTQHRGDTPDFALIRRLSQTLTVPVIAEGRIWTPEQLGQVLSAGAYTAVVGSAITRPQLIAKRFSHAMASYTETV